MTGLLLTGGRVLPPPGWKGWREGRADPQLWPTSVAVHDGWITAVGDDVQAAGPDVDVVDLAGRLVVPGFIDAHCHPISAGLERLRCDLTGIVSGRATLDAVARYAAANPGSGWITGGNWSMEAFPGGTPTALALDAVVGDRPVFLPNRDHHSAWVSSATLRLAGIDANTPDPPGGRIERGPGGRPSGTLHEDAMVLVARHVPAVTDAETDAGLREAQRYLHAFGITGWQDAIVGEYPGVVNGFETYLRAQGNRTLDVDVVGALWWPRGLSLADVDTQVGALVQQRARVVEAARAVTDDGGRIRFRAGVVKIMVDGVVESFTAAMHHPYHRHDQPGLLDTGISYLDHDLLCAIVGACDAAGFAVHLHAIGDRAVAWSLDAVAVAHAALGRTGLAHQIAHLQVVSAPDVVRWAELGVIANLQALWACHEPQMDELTIPFLGAERSARQYPFGELHRAGVPLAMGSDWSVSSPDPLAAIHVAVNRRVHGALGLDRYGLPRPRFLPEQALDVVTALHAYTAGSAVACGLTDVGQIRVGARADLAVLDRNPVSGPADEIGATRVDLTIGDGVVRFSR